MIKNSELNLDFSEWVTNVLFQCKYGYNLGDCSNENCQEESGIYDERNFDTADYSKANNEENYMETKFSNIGGMMDNSTNLFGTPMNKSEFAGFNNGEYQTPSAHLGSKIVYGNLQQPQQVPKNNNYAKKIGMEVEGESANI